MADVISIFLKLEQVRSFVRDSERASKAVTGVGDAAEETGKKAKVSWKGVAKWAGGAAALYGAQRYVRGAVDATEDLGRATLTLQRTTGMDVETASAWASIAKSRGLATRQLQVGFVKLSKEIEKSRLGTAKEKTTMAELNKEYAAVREAGGKKAPAALAKLNRAMNKAEAQGDKTRTTLAALGVTQAAIAKGNTNQVLNQVADGLAKIENPAQRAALAQQLFGRGGQALLPILMKGRKGIQDQMAVVKRYGATLGVKTVDQLKTLLANQREMGIAMQGARVQLGTALLPVLLQVTTIITSLARALAPLTKNATLLKVALGFLVVAFIAYKVAMLAATIAQVAFNVSLGLSVLWIGLIVIAIAALVIGVVIAYKKIGWFRKAVQGVWSWIKENWPLLLAVLLGPFALAAVAIIKNFDKIKRFVLGVVDAIRKAVQKVIDLVKGIPGQVTGALGKIPGAGVVGGARDLLPFAEGGRMPRRGLALVGERGPEVVALPGGASVTPLAAPRALAVDGGGAAGAGALIEIPLYLDGKEVARSVARVTADKLARR